jgi:RND superfamily putative drug exporter
MEFRMGPVSRWAVRHPVWTILVWFLLVAGIAVAAKGLGGTYNDSFKLPATDSTRAQDILAKEYGDQANAATAEIVFSPATGPITAPAVEQQVTALLGDVAKIHGIATVASPYDKGAAQQGLVSPTGTVGKAEVTFTGAADQVSQESVKKLVSTVEAANNATVQVGVGGQVIDFAGSSPPKSEGIGILVALVILLLMFCVVIAAGLPILTAILGLSAGLSLVTVAAKFTDIATFGPVLATMIGLGVGIDYSLFVVNRYRQAHDVGREPKEAAFEAVNTAGRAVVFAGSTVIIALLGLFVMRINFMNGLAVGAALTVLMVMLTAVTLLPALISLLGRFVLWPVPWSKFVAPKPEGGAFARYGQILQKRPWLFGGAALIFMLALASPVLSMRLGFPDASGKPVGDTQRIAYDLTSKGFGPGANGPFVVVAQLPAANDLTGATALSQAIGKTDGVAFASPPVPSKSGNVALIQVQPTTGPQDAATSALLKTLRADVVPAATAGTGVTAYIGGETAIVEDFSQVLSSAMPVFLTVVMGLGFLMLMILFRSVVVPLTAVFTSLLSFGAALGATVAVFQWGHLKDLFAVTGTGPILPFLPVMLFAILFGLSMDYEVFLVSRMQEEWERTHDNLRSVRRGLAGSGRVVAAAAAIMASVFASFIFGKDSTIKMFGLALSVAVLLDAFVVRLILIPSLMTILGKVNWWLPGWLRRLLPPVHIETEEEAAEIADVDDDLQPVGPTGS